MVKNNLSFLFSFHDFYQPIGVNYEFKPLNRSFHHLFYSKRSESNFLVFNLLEKFIHRVLFVPLMKRLQISILIKSVATLAINGVK